MSKSRIGISASYYQNVIASKKEYDKWMKILKTLENGEKMKHFTYRNPLDFQNNKEKEEIEESVFTVEISQVKRKIDCEVINIVINVTTFLEAYIWDLGAYHLGENYMKEHLEKLGILSKWEIIPKLITGREIELNDQDLGAFRNLIKFRNFLVHSKSENLYKLLNRLQEKDERYKCLYEKIDIPSILPFVGRLMKQLDKVSSNGGHYSGLVDWYRYIEDEENQLQEIFKKHS